MPIAFRLGWLSGGLDAEPYEVGQGREDRRIRNKAMADFENSLETLLRFELLQHEQADGRNRIIVQLAKEFKISERRIESRLASARAILDDEHYKRRLMSLPWFVEMLEHVRRAREQS